MIDENTQAGTCPASGLNTPCPRSKPFLNAPASAKSPRVGLCRGSPPSPATLFRATSIRSLGVEVGPGPLASVRPHRNGQTTRFALHPSVDRQEAVVFRLETGQPIARAIPVGSKSGRAQPAAMDRLRSGLQAAADAVPLTLFLRLPNSARLQPSLEKFRCELSLWNPLEMSGPSGWRTPSPNCSREGGRLRTPQKGSRRDWLRRGIRSSFI